MTRRFRTTVMVPVDVEVTADNVERARTRVQDELGSVVHLGRNSSDTSVRFRRFEAEHGAYEQVVPSVEMASVGGVMRDDLGREVDHG